MSTNYLLPAQGVMLASRTANLAPFHTWVFTTFLYTKKEYDGLLGTRAIDIVLCKYVTTVYNMDVDLWEETFV